MSPGGPFEIVPNHTSVPASSSPSSTDTEQAMILLKEASEAVRSIGCFVIREQMNFIEREEEIKGNSGAVAKPRLEEAPPKTAKENPEGASDPATMDFKTSSPSVEEFSAHPPCVTGCIRQVEGEAANSGRGRCSRGGDEPLRRQLQVVDAPLALAPPCPASYNAAASPVRQTSQEHEDTTPKKRLRRMVTTLAEIRQLQELLLLQLEALAE